MQDVIDFNLLKEYDGTLKEVLKVWQKQKSYSVNEVIQYKGNYLKCTTAGTSGTTTLDFTGVEIGDTITDGTVVWEMIEPLYSAATGVEYSTEERKVGTWIDGKPLYQKTVEFTTPSQNSFQEYSYLPGIPFSSIDKIISIDGWCARVDGWRVPHLFSQNQLLYFCVDWNKTAQKIYFYVSTNGTSGTANQPATLTFRYTKTTD